MLAALGGATPVSLLRVDVADLRNAKGVLQFCVTAVPTNFPECDDDARAISRIVRAGDRDIVFDGLPRGDFAIAVFHDENRNSRLDTFAGIPREGLGFSRNPRIGFGPPRFASARFTLAGDTEKQQVKMRYFL